MPASEYKELVEYLDEKFGLVDRKIEAVDRRFDTVDKRFDTIDGLFGAVAKQFTVVDGSFDGLDHRLASLEGKFDLLLTSVDGYAKRADTYFQEMVVMAHKVERIERWLHQVADKVGLKLEL